MSIVKLLFITENVEKNIFLYVLISDVNIHVYTFDNEVEERIEKILFHSPC